VHAPTANATNKDVVARCGRRRKVPKSWLMPRLFTLFLAALACVTALPPRATFAQPGQVTIRGFRFDPVDLQGATAEELVRFGIEEGLQARAPNRNDVPHWRLLQFSRPIDRETRRDLVARGLELQRYMAGVYLERVTLDTVEELRSNGVLGASVLYHPSFKLSPEIRGARLLEPRTFETAQRRAVRGSLLSATAFPATDLDATAREIRRVGGLDVIVEDNSPVRLPGRLVFRLDGAGNERVRALVNVARIEEIESIEEVGEFIRDNAEAAGVNQSGDGTQRTIWNRGLTGQGQVIGIFDYGVADTNHCFFNDPVDNTPGMNHRKLLEVRDQSGISDDDDTGYEHATIVASIAAGDDFNVISTHGAERGGAWAAKLVLVNVYDFMIATPLTSLAVEVGAVAQEANVSSFSWHYQGVGKEGYSAFAVQFDSLARTHEDHLLVAAAGRTDAVWGPPAIAKNSITVSAASFDAMLIAQGYQNNPYMGRRKPDLAAVGCGMRTARGNTCDVTAALTCATSYATPQAAAIAALARQYYVDGLYDGVSRRPTGSLVKATLINSAQDVTLAPGFPSEREGWGVVRLDRTLAFTDSDHVLWIEDVSSTDTRAFQTGEMRDHTFSVPASSQPLKVTLVWTDAPGTAGDGTLKNDLDLEVISPPATNGAMTSYFGNNFNLSIGTSIPGPADTDADNNVEQVIVNAPPIGKWTLRVKAQNIAQIEPGAQGQGYALVATAAKPMATNVPTPNPPNLSDPR
jgi:hypothetical protein